MKLHRAAAIASMTLALLGGIAGLIAAARRDPTAAILYTVNIILAYAFLMHLVVRRGTRGRPP